MAKAKLMKEKDMALTVNDHERAGTYPIRIQSSNELTRGTIEVNTNIVSKITFLSGCAFKSFGYS
jgi:hypothetical protein